MSMDYSIPFDELEKRRRRASEARKLSVTQPQNPATDSKALAVINEIFNPSLKLPVSTGHYKPPDAIVDGSYGGIPSLDTEKLAELKEVFLLLDTDSDGLISKDDLRFTFIALGTTVPDDFLEEMLNEAKTPLNYEAFVELMTFRTIELDPEDVLLEAWSKWDEYGTGKIEERKIYEELTNYGDRLSMSEAKEALKYAPLAKPKSLEEPPMIDYPAFCRILCGLRKRQAAVKDNYCVDLFPQLREPMIESSSKPEYIYCNPSKEYENSSRNQTFAMQNNITDFPLHEALYSFGKVFGIRFRYKREFNFQANITGDYEFIKKETYRNDGRLVSGSFCDYYYFANTDNSSSQNNSTEEWKYFHSPRYPAKYPAHIKCAYKFIGSPDNRVEVHFDDLHIPKHSNRSCNADKIVIFDSESANMDKVIDVICEAPIRRIISTGPDMLIEFNASSNKTAKGFRGKFKFLKSLKTSHDNITTNEIKLINSLENQRAVIEKQLQESYVNRLDQIPQSLNTLKRKDVTARSIQIPENVYQSFVSPDHHEWAQGV